MKRILFCVVLIAFTSVGCVCQTSGVSNSTEPLDTAYVEAQYGVNNSNLGTFILDKLYPILENCVDHDNLPTGGSYFQLLISEKGEVIDVKTVRFKYPVDCESEVLAEFLKMDAWIPATQNGVPVESRKIFPVVIKWEF